MSYLYCHVGKLALHLCNTKMQIKFKSKFCYCSPSNEMSYTYIKLLPVIPWVLLLICKMHDSSFLDICQLWSEFESEIYILY